MLRSDTRDRYIDNLVRNYELLLTNGFITLPEGDDRESFLVGLRHEISDDDDYSLVDHHQLVFEENNQEHVNRCLHNLKNFFPSNATN